MSSIDLQPSFGAAKSAYILHGDERPALEDLQFYMEAVLAPNKATKITELNRFQHTLLADVYLDASRVSDDTGHYVDMAKAELEAIAADPATHVAKPSILAMLRLSDIPLWRASETPYSGPSMYDHRLNAVERVLSTYPEKTLTKPKNKHVFSEMVPIILGARAIDGPQGRFALLREETREAEQGATGKNWDIVLSHDQPDLFDKTGLRVQLKMTPGGGRNKLREAGVATIFASQCGFSEPLHVLRACVDEAYGPISAELDEIAGLLDEKLDQEQELIDTFAEQKAS
jgi:hypothetical protein